MLALVGCGNDVVTTKYQTYDEAASDQLFGRGWLPEFIPSSSFNITTSNNLDLNTSKGEFSFSPTEMESFVSKLAPYSGRVSRHAEFQETVKERQVDGYTPYEFTRDNDVWVFFLNREKGHAYYSLWPL
jgi:hypothetical protein